MHRRSMVVGAGVVLAVIAGLLPLRSFAAGPPAYRQRVLVKPNDVMKSTGLSFCGGNSRYLYSADTLRNSIFRVDLHTGTVDRIATDHDAAHEVLFSPHTLATDGTGLYATEYTTKEVTRLTCDGGQRRTIASGITNLATGGVTSPAGIAFDDANRRLFVTESTHDRERPGRLWEVDPSGLRPPLVVADGLGLAELVAVGPDGRAYVADTYGDAVHVVNVDNGMDDKERLEGFDQAFGVAFRGDDLLVATLTGELWTVDPKTGSRSLLARTDRVGLAAIAVAPDDGTVYVSNGLIGGLFRVDEVAHEFKPVVRVGEFAAPTSLNEAPAKAGLPGRSFWVGDGSSISTVGPGGQVDHLSYFLHSRNHPPGQYLTTSVLQTPEGSIYFTESFPGLADRLSVMDPDGPDGPRVLMHFEPLSPFLVRSGPPGHLLLSLQGVATGRVVDVDLATCNAQKETCNSTTVVDGMRTPGGLRYDPATKVSYVSETDTGRIYSIDLSSGERKVVAEGLDTPEGLDLDGRGGLVVVEGDGDRRLLHIDLATGSMTEIASNLATRVRGPAPKPLAIEYLSDVLVLDNGSIVVSTLEDSRVIIFDPIGAAK